MFRNSFYIGLALFFAAFVVLAADKAYDSLPTEGSQHLSQIAAYPDASTILLHSIRKNWMGSTGIQAYQIHEVRYIGDSAGVADWKEIQIPFFEGRDSVEIITATLYFPTGEPYDADIIDDISIVTPELLKSATDFSRFKEYQIRFPKLRIGTIVELKYRVIINKPLVPWEYGRCDMVSTEPILYREYITKVPMGDTTNYSLDNGAPEPRLDSNFATWYFPEARGVSLDTLRGHRDEIPSVQWSSVDEWSELVQGLQKRIADVSRDSVAIPESLSRRFKRVKAGKSRINLVRSWAGSNLKLINYPYHRDFPLTMRTPEVVLKSGYGNALELAVLIRKIGLQLGESSDIVLRFDRTPRVPQLADWRGVLLGVSDEESAHYVLPLISEPGKNNDVTDTWLLPITNSTTAPLLAPAERWN